LFGSITDYYFTNNISIKTYAKIKLSADKSLLSTTVTVALGLSSIGCTQLH
jgi:hypothetical protein